MSEIKSIEGLIHFYSEVNHLTGHPRFMHMDVERLHTLLKQRTSNDKDNPTLQAINDFILNAKAYIKENA